MTATDEKRAVEKRGVSDSAAALRADIEKVFPPPPTQKGVFARAVPHDRVVVEDRDARAMRHLAEEIENRTAAVERMHATTGTRIEAWQELPKESAFAVAEAREIADLMDTEIKLIEALRSSLGRALHAAKGDQLAAAKKRIESLRDEVERWQRDAEADKQALLVHGRAELEQKADGQNNGEGAVAVPLPVQAQRAMADAIQHRSEVEGNDNATREAILAEQRSQIDLEKKLGEALDAARDAMASAGVAELRASLDAVRAWGYSLAFEARRFKKLG
ncbi:MAG TPA: hypothetical protein VGO62_17750 [Myxococcota bacterium]